jgi:hypothetical protein
VLAAGDPIPPARVWTGPRDELAIDSLAEEGALLAFFYLFDWSKSQ